MKKYPVLWIDEPRLNSLTAQSNRLFRPKVDCFSTTAIALVFFIVAVVISYFLAIGYSYFENDTLTVNNLNKKLIFVLPISIGFGVLTFSKYILIHAIKYYQRYASASRRLRCCFEPTCSDYSILAIKKYGAFFGFIKTISRLRRCGDMRGVDYP